MMGNENQNDQPGRRFSMESATITRERVVARLWELACIPPEKTRGTLNGQIDACKMLHGMGFPLAIQRLREIAGMDASRTGGNSNDQGAADRLLLKIVREMEPESPGIQ
jgi:hypothetical protein